MKNFGFSALADRLGHVPATPVLAASLVALLGATAAIARGYFWPGGGLVAVGAGLDLLAAALVRRQGGPKLFSYAPLALFLPAFGFALADPARALAAMFLVMALAVLACVRAVEAQEIDSAKIGGAAVYIAACLLPDHFSLLAYLTGIVCFILAGQGAAKAWKP